MRRAIMTFPLSRQLSITLSSVICGVSVLFGGAALAGPVDLDTSFAGDGTVKVADSRWQFTQTVSVHDDVIYAAGNAMGGGSGEFSSWISSVDSSGVPINSRTYSAWCDGGHFPENRDILVTGEADVLVVGYARGYYETPGYGYIVRLNSDLTRDTAWSDESDLECGTPTNGMRYLNSFDLTDVSSATLDSQGRIVLAGSIFGDFAALRLLDDGTLDDTFGGNGVVRLRSLGSNELSFDVATTPSDAVLVSGRSTVPQYGSPQGVIVKLTETGSLSDSWGNAGTRTFKHHYAQVEHMSILGDGKLLVGLTSYDQVGVARVLADGANDSTFTSTGRLDIDCRARRNTVGYESQLSDLTVHQRQAGGYRVQAYFQCKTPDGLVPRIGGWLNTGSPAHAFNDQGLVKPPWNMPVISADVMSDSDTIAVMRGPNGFAELLVRMGTGN